MQLLSFCIETFINSSNLINRTPGLLQYKCVILYLIETPFNTFANRANQDQAALVRAIRSLSTLFAYGKND